LTGIPGIQIFIPDFPGIENMGGNGFPRFKPVEIEFGKSKN
jgi:hypothetical protein